MRGVLARCVVVVWACGLLGCRVAAQEDIFRDRVLPPSTDLTVDAGDVHVWNRTFSFGDGPVPEGITSAGEELLAGPATLSVIVGGETARWSAQQPTQTGPVRWERACQAAAGNLRASAVTSVEFDGFCRVDLSLQPQGRAMLQRVELRLPLRPEVAKLYTHHVLGVERVRSLRWDLRAQSERQWWAGEVAGGTTNMQFTPQVWLGTTERGLAWCAETPTEWRPVAADNAIGIEAEGNATTLVVRMVAEDRELTQPLSFSFGITPTPIKPWRQDMADTRITHSAAAPGPDDFRERLMTPGAYAEEPVISNLRDQITVAGWVWPQETGKGWIFYNNAISLEHRAGDGKLIFGLNDEMMGEHSMEAECTLGLEQWQHIAATYDGETMRVLVGGRQIGEKRDRFAFRSIPSVPATVGANNRGVNAWHGRLDELGIFTRALTADEIALLMDGRLPEDAATSVAGWWTFDGSPRDMLIDGDGPHRLALRFVDRDDKRLEPPLDTGRRGWALVLAGDRAEVTGNRENLTGLQYLKHQGVDVLLLWNNWSDIWGYPGVTSPRYKSFLHELLDAAHAAGLKVIPYIMIAIMMEDEPEYAQMAPRVVPEGATPFRRGNVQGYNIQKNQAWAEYYSGKLADLAREFDIDGIYMDGGGLTGTLDTELPDEAGMAGDFTRYDVYGSRELMRRVACVFHGGVREDGLILTHDSAPFVCSQDAFTDVQLTGELHYWLLAFRRLTEDAGVPFIKRWPPALMQAWFSGETYGVPMMFTGKHRNKQYNDGERKPLRGAITDDDEIIAALASVGAPALTNCALRLPTDLDVPWWQARDAIGRGDCTWHPYWRNSELVSVEPDEVKVSLLRHEPDKALMLVVVNMGDRPADARVALHPEALGARRWLVARTMPEWLHATIEQDVITVRVGAGEVAFVIATPAGPE